MSQIKSNSLDSFDLQQIEPTNHTTKVLNTLLSIPLSVPQQINPLIPNQQSAFAPLKQFQTHLLHKSKLFLKHLLNNTKYKNQLKKLLENLSELDKLKTLSGLSSCQKDLLKFSIVLKHHDMEYCRNYLANLMVRVIVGDEEQQQK